MIYIFTGDGKGKTSAALGVMLRGLTQGWRVSWISWYKEAAWEMSEHKLHTILNPDTLSRLQFLPMGKGFFIQKPERTVGNTKIAPVNDAVVIDDDTPQEHKAAACGALKKASELIKDCELLVLDEVCNAVAEGLLEEAEVLRLLKTVGPQGPHVILTGRSASLGLIEKADLVSEIVKKKHPFDAGKLAVMGLDF